MRTAQPSIRAFIDASAALAGLPVWQVRGEEYQPGEWLEGLILQESGGQPESRRYEPHLDRVADGDATGQDDGASEDDASWGPMQVLGTNVKALLGIQPRCSLLHLNALYDWHLGMAFGLAVLRGELEATGRNVTRALCRYNGGPTGDALTPGTSRFRLQAYADGVEHKTILVREDRRKIRA